jgi:hypothetical protein
VTAADMAAFRPPAAFLGYSAQATDQALEQIARVVADRDAELAMLRRENAILRARPAPPAAPEPGDTSDAAAAAFTSPAWQLDPEAGPEPAQAPPDAQAPPGEQA